MMVLHNAVENCGKVTFEARFLRISIYHKVARGGACARDMSCFAKSHFNRGKIKR